MQSLKDEELKKYVFFCPKHGKKRIPTKITSGCAMYEPLHFNGYCSKCKRHTVEIGIEEVNGSGVVLLRTQPSISKKLYDDERELERVRHNRKIFALQVVSMFGLSFSHLFILPITPEDILLGVGQFVMWINLLFFTRKKYIFPRNRK